MYLGLVRHRPAILTCSSAHREKEAWRWDVSNLACGPGAKVNEGTNDNYSLLPLLPVGAPDETLFQEASLRLVEGLAIVKLI